MTAPLVWRFAEGARVLSSAPVGGGLGLRHWIVNAAVPVHYDRRDLDEHIAEIARALDLRGPGVGMLTAASLDAGVDEDGGVRATATVGVTRPTWAADVEDAVSAWSPGTINIVVELPVALGDAALVNAVITATEAKAQALAEHHVPGTGTASDAVCIVCPATGRAEPFAGPRSTWGARIARAVHGAVGMRLP